MYFPVVGHLYNSTFHDSKQNLEIIQLLRHIILYLNTSCALRSDTASGKIKKILRELHLKMDSDATYIKCV